MLRLFLAALVGTSLVVQQFCAGPLLALSRNSQNVGIYDTGQRFVHEKKIIRYALTSEPNSIVTDTLDNLKRNKSKINWA